MNWLIQTFPTCTHHVFLSHSAEDRATLVHPTYERLGRAGVVPWLDRHDYPSGRPSRVALRDAVLRCRHAVFFVTHAMLRQARGWCVQELAWVELLQDNLVGPGGTLLNVSLPLFFVPHEHDRLPRSVWQAARDRGVFYPGQVPRADWAADQIARFLAREQLLAGDQRRATLRQPDVRAGLRPRTGLLDRVTRFDPQPLPSTGSPVRPRA